jgi:hypothetical protein
MRQRREPQRVFQRRPLIYPERLLEVLRATGGGGGARELDRRSRRRGCHPRDARALSRCGGLRRTGANAGSRRGSIARGVTPVSTSTTRERNSLSRRSRSGETGSSAIWATRSRSRLTRRPVPLKPPCVDPEAGALESRVQGSVPGSSLTPAHNNASHPAILAVPSRRSDWVHHSFTLRCYRQHSSRFKTFSSARAGSASCGANRGAGRLASDRHRTLLPSVHLSASRTRAGA